MTFEAWKFWKERSMRVYQGDIAAYMAACSMIIRKQVLTGVSELVTSVCISSAYQPSVNGGCRPNGRDKIRDERKRQL